jgi:hypothetical protein
LLLIRAELVKVAAGNNGTGVPVIGAPSAKPFSSPFFDI